MVVRGRPAWLRPEQHHDYQTAERVTYYHRRAFTVSDPAAYSSLIVRLRRDDGGIVYLNDVEVFRSNMPAGAVDFLTIAAISTTGPHLKHR